MKFTPTTTLSRSAAAAATLSLIAGPALLVPLIQPADAVTAPRIVNGDAESGTTGFTTTPVDAVRLTSSPTSHSGATAVRLTSSRPVRAVLDTTSPDTDVAAGSTVATRAWVRTARAGQSVTIVLREVTATGTVQTQRQTRTPRRGSWVSLQAGIVTRDADSSLDVSVLFPRTRTTLDALVDDVEIAASPIATPPTPPTTPAPSPEAGTLSNGCAHDQRGLPACGAYLGATYNSNSDPAVLESQVGRRLGVRRTFWTSTGVAKAVETARADVAHGRLPWISFKLPYSWEAMTAGQGDRWARDLATRLASVPGPVWVAFHHEPEGDGDIQAWRTMQERLAPLVRGIAPNVAYTVVVTGWNQFFGADQYSLANIWPRGVKIDVAGFDLYNEYGVVKNGRTTTTWPDFDRDYYAPIQAWAAREGVAWGVAETAYTDEAHARTPSWITTSYDQLVARDGVAYAYFDTALNAYGSWALGSASKRAGLAAPLRASAALPLP